VNKNWLVLPLGIVLSAAMADDVELSKEELASKLSGVEVGDISESPLQGVYQISVGQNVGYVTADGRYLLQGELWDLETSENLTESFLASERAPLLAGVDTQSMLVFSPEDGEAKHTITIFTDIDCGYCRQFHREIEQVNALGVEVHYLFYPRTGPDTESWAKADKVWCASDRNTAYTRATLGGSVPDSSCEDTPVAGHYDLGHQVGVRGTPAIFTETGENIGGYLTPTALIELLDELSQ